MTRCRELLVAALCISASVMPAQAQRGPTQDELSNAGTSTEWLLPHHDYAAHRFVDLDQITPANASSLRPVCIYQAGDLNRFPTNPLVYRGTLYFTTGVSTIALDAATCRQRWRHDWKAKGKEAFPSNRGAAIKDGKIIRGTNDGYLIALDAANGQLLWDRQVGDPDKFERVSIAPLIYEDLIIIGLGVSELGVKGWLGAFRVRDGEPVWRFNTVPDVGEPGAETWGSAEALQRGGGAVWMPPSLDTATGLIYVPVGNPTPYIFGAVRPGANLYTNALIVSGCKDRRDAMVQAVRAARHARLGSGNRGAAVW